MSFDNRYSEIDWRNYSDARELAQLRDDERDMAELTIESTPRETKGELVRASEYVSTMGWCDSSGYFETQTDVDMTRGIACPGCPACEAEQPTGRRPVFAPRLGARILGLLEIGQV